MKQTSNNANAVNVTAPSKGPTRPNLSAKKWARIPEPMALKFDIITESRRMISRLSSGKSCLRCSVTNQDSKIVDKRFAVTPPTTLEMIKPLIHLYCSRRLMIISSIQYAIAADFRPNLSTSGPVNGDESIPATKPVA